jgi:signal peptidase I
VDDIVPEERLGWAGGVFRIVFYAMLLAVFIRTFLFQPYNIPSSSMEETLLVGDYLFVTKFTRSPGRRTCFRVVSGAARPIVAMSLSSSCRRVRQRITSSVSSAFPVTGFR